MAKHTDASKLLAGAQAKLNAEKVKRDHKSADRLLAAAKKRGTARRGDAARVEAKLASAQAKVRTARTKD